MNYKILLLLGLMGAPLRAVSLDGTSAVVYQSGPYAFSDGNVARGFVWLAGGLSVPADGTVTLDLPIPVSGPITCNETGKLSLGSDLYLASDASFADGCKVDGADKSIHLRSSLKLPAGKTFEITSNTTINGNGNRLDLNGSNFYVNGASATTLRLKNMVLYGLRDLSDTIAAIRFGETEGHRLVLDNVTIYLTGDYTFAGGALSIVETVKLIGDHTFNYTSSKHCIINHGSMLMLDMHVTFNYQPEDRLAKHLVFKGRDAALFLHGGTLFVPKANGINLVKGHLIVDHKSYIQQDWVPDDDFGVGGGRVVFGDGKHKGANMAVDIMPSAQLVNMSAAISFGNIDLPV